MAYLHHTLLHFPVALGLTATMFVLLGWITGVGRWASLGRTLTYWTAPLTILTVVSGLLAAPHLLHEGFDTTLVARHRNTGLGAAVSFLVAAALMWMGTRLGSKIVNWLGAMAVLSGSACVGLAAHRGGDMLHPGLAPWADEHHAHHHRTGIDARESGEMPHVDAATSPVPTDADHHPRPGPAAEPAQIGGGEPPEAGPRRHDHRTHAHDHPVS